MSVSHEYYPHNNSQHAINREGTLSYNQPQAPIMQQLFHVDEPNTNRLLLRNISHNVRTAMNAIIGLTDISLSSEADIARMLPLQYVKNSAVILQAFLGHVMDLSLLESSHFRMREELFSIRETIENLGEIFTHELAAKKMAFYIWIHDDVPQMLIGDPERLKRIVLSLVQHALSLCQSGQVLIEVQKNHVEATTTTLQFSVLHTGEPFSLKAFHMDLQKYVHDLQPESIDLTPIELGLYITGRLLNHNGAQIWIGQKGKRFHSFNFLQSFQTSTLTEAATAPKSAPRVGLLTKDVLLRRIITHMLHAHNYNVIALHPSSGTISNPDAFDVLISDNRKKHSHKLKAIEQHVNVPIIFIDEYWHPNHTSTGNTNLTWNLALPLTSHQLLLSVNHSLGRENQENDIERLGKMKSHVRILLVEDIYINQEVIKSLTSRPGLRVDIANDGQEALNILQHTSYDLILMDVQMPNLDGYVTTRKIRNDLQLRHVPIIALTAFSEQGDRERCLLSGMNDYLSKPIEPSHFYRLLRKWLEKKSPIQ
ncbi:response regulator [candidate division KSB1 bacterium]|nr:response regulator [candidate division KSB1 bacterium]